jgi:isopenicillin N synthase-like dioxygenase
MQVVTNGRVPACVHRVRTPSKRERLSALFGSSLRPGAVVSALEELVDHDRRPLRFRPCDFDEYVKFRFAQERPALNSALQEFCGIDPTK